MWKRMIIIAAWTFLVSFAAFFAVDVGETVYAILVACIWVLLRVQYRYDGNGELYGKAFVLFTWNFLAYICTNLLRGERLNLCFCAVYGGFLVVVTVLFWYQMRRQGKAEENRHLFRERVFDRERLESYLSVFSIVGINGPWGSGKSFVTDHIDQTGYIPIKIDLLVCNLDEIQSVLLNELDKVLREYGIFSTFSPKIKNCCSRTD